MKLYHSIILAASVVFGLSSCQDFLEEKPDKSILVPASPEDVRALLDYYPNLNQNSLITFIISDDWETTVANLESLQQWEQNAFLWKTEIFDPNTQSTDYIRLHNQIFTANVCLDVLNKLDGESEEIKNLHGEALAFRARSLFELSLLFLPHPLVEDIENYKIPIHLKPEINSEPEYLGIQETLVIVEQDLLDAFSLLGEKGSFRTRPDRISVKALLSRLYLYQERWEEALESGKYVFQSEYELMDFNYLDSLLAYPFDVFNSETLQYGVTSSFSVTASSSTYVNSELYGQYAGNDMRKGLFFTLDSDSLPLYRGSYIGDYNLFTGIGLSEVYLTMAESAIRIGETEEGLAYLNALGVHRYSEFEEWNLADPAQILSLVLEERRKELVFKGTRWMDMKRMKRMGSLNVPVRMINGEEFLLADENQFTLQVPAYELELESNR